MIFIIALVLFIVYSAIVNLIKEMSTASIAYPKITQLPKDFFPDYSQDLFVPTHEKLKARGCLGPLWFKIESETMPNRYFAQAYLAFYFDPKYQTMISVQPSASIDMPNILYLSCITPTENNTWIHTTNMATSMLEQTPDTQLDIVDLVNIEEVIFHHLERLKSAKQSINFSMTSSAIADHWLDIKKRYAMLIEEKRIIDDPNQKQYVLTWKGWQPLFKNIFKPLKQLIKDQDTPTERMVEFHQMQEQMLNFKKIPLKLKIFFPIFSCILFLIAAYFIFDIETGAILLFVIMFHEFGHYFAMKKCGYKNVDLAAVPLLGGVTTGIPQKYNQYQQAWIPMWGPLPGIILGLILSALLYFKPELYLDFSHLSEIIIFLFIINYFNLLPILPMDGGHILVNLIPNRFIKLYRTIVIMTTILGMAIIFTLDLPMFLLFLFALPLFSLERDMALYKIVQQIKQSPQYMTMNNQALLVASIEAVKAKFPKKTTKVQLAYIKNVYLNISEVTMTKAQRAGLLSVYLLLFTPFIGAGLYFYHGITSWTDQIKTAQYQSYETLKDLKLLNPPITPSERSDFEHAFKITMPKDLAELYNMANGSQDHYIAPSHHVDFVEHNTMWQDLIRSYPPMEYSYDNDGNEIQTPISLPRNQWLPILAHPKAIVLINIKAQDDKVWLQCNLYSESKSMYCDYSESYPATYIFSLYKHLIDKKEKI